MEDLIKGFVLICILGIIAGLWIGASNGKKKQKKAFDAQDSDDENLTIEEHMRAFRDSGELSDENYRVLKDLLETSQKKEEEGKGQLSNLEVFQVFHRQGSISDEDYEALKDFIDGDEEEDKWAEFKIPIDPEYLQMLYEQGRLSEEEYEILLEHVDDSEESDAYDPLLHSDEVLDGLLESGEITEEEYEAQKRRVEETLERTAKALRYIVLNMTGRITVEEYKILVDQIEFPQKESEEEGEA